MWTHDARSLRTLFPVTQSRLLLATTVTLGVLAHVLPVTAASPDDSAIFAEIELLRTVADEIVVDGACGDWGAIPLFDDAVGDAGGDATRDITAVAIAPGAEMLRVRIDVAGVPPATAADYWLQVDYRNQQDWDLVFSLSSEFVFFDANPELGESGGGRRPWTSAHAIAVGASCIEVEIPYAALETQLPPVMQGQLTGPSARSWLRVRAMTGEPQDFFDSEIDFGAAVGSFRLVETPYPLDPPLSPGAADPVATLLPLLGTWYLGQGSHGVKSHASLPWAYDWHRVNGSLQPEVPERSPVLEDNFSYGEAIFAPTSGTAGSGFGHVDDQPDCTPYAACPPGAFANNLFLELPDGLGILFSHTLPGSLGFAPGASIPVGAEVARIGNSGSPDSWPHLHHEIRDTNLAGDPKLPIELVGVEVGLNPDLDADPWRRRFSRWAPREGFFARRDPPGVPGLPLAGLLLLMAASWATARLQVASRSQHPHGSATRSQAGCSTRVGPGRVEPRRSDSIKPEASVPPRKIQIARS